MSDGHSPLPKQDSAACASGHTANVLAPLTSSVCRYSPSSTLNRIPSASWYSRRDSPTSAVTGPKPAMKSTFMEVSLPETPPIESAAEDAGVAHLAERDLPKVEVAGSSPVSRSTDPAARAEAQAIVRGCDSSPNPHGRIRAGRIRTTSGSKPWP